MLTGCTAPTVQPVTAETDIPPVGRYAALTFDDGPSPTCTPILLDGLRERGVHATFFLIGSKIDGQEELVRRMQAEGHQIGNHSYDHAMLQKTDTASALRDLARCDAALQQLLGRGRTGFARPTGSSVRRSSRRSTRRCCTGQLTRATGLRDADKVLDIILREADDGDVILLHDCYAASVEAALRAIDRLQAWGVRFVTVEELFRIKGVDVQDGVLYKCPGATHPAAG